jgi:hypothetical protein
MRLNAHRSTPESNDKPPLRRMVPATEPQANPVARRKSNGSSRELASATMEDIPLPGKHHAPMRTQALHSSMPLIRAQPTKEPVRRLGHKEGDGAAYSRPGSVDSLASTAHLPRNEVCGRSTSPWFCFDACA